MNRLSAPGVATTELSGLMSLNGRAGCLGRVLPDALSLRALIRTCQSTQDGDDLGVGPQATWAALLANCEALPMFSGALLSQSPRPDDGLPWRVATDVGTHTA